MLERNILSFLEYMGTKTQHHSHPSYPKIDRVFSFTSLSNNPSPSPRLTSPLLACTGTLPQRPKFILAFPWELLISKQQALSNMDSFVEYIYVFFAPAQLRSPYREGFRQTNWNL